MKATYYVYQLETESVPFYVGKGSGNRMRAHEREARNGVSSEKCNKIRDIWARGLEVDRRQIAFFFDERSAYDFEAELIQSIGLQNLTNVAPAQLTEEQLRARTNPFLSAAFFRALAIWMRVESGNYPEPQSSRPFARALYWAMKRRGYKTTMATALKRISVDQLKSGLRTFGVVLEYGS